MKAQETVINNRDGKYKQLSSWGMVKLAQDALTAAEFRECLLASYRAMDPCERDKLDDNLERLCKFKGVGHQTAMDALFKVWLFTCNFIRDM